MTNSPRRTRPRGTRDPYGIGPVSGYVGPVIAIVALLIIAFITIGLAQGQLPFSSGTSGTNGGGGNGGGPAASPAPSNVVIVEPEVTFPGSIVYGKAGNIWIQTGKDAHQLTDGGNDAMPAYSADGQWVYFIRTVVGKGKFPGGGGNRTWYDLETPTLMRIKPDGTGAQRLLTGRFVQGTSTWFYWLRQPTPSPDGKTVTVISDGPNPLQSDVIVKSFNLATKQLTSLNLPESGSLGHQDPAWRPDGRILLFVHNGRELTRGAPQIYRFDAVTKKAFKVTGPGYLQPSWSTDIHFFAATRTDSFGTDIVILDTSGKEVLRVTDDGHSFSPVWSPAGDAIAFLHLSGTSVDLRMATLDPSSGHWAVSKTVDLTKVSGLDGASRPSWFIPASEMPAPTTAPSPSGSAAPSDSGSSAP